jgi:hypothetical protein
MPLTITLEQGKTVVISSPIFDASTKQLKLHLQFTELGFDFIISFYTPGIKYRIEKEGSLQAAVKGLLLDLWNEYAAAKDLVAMIGA